MTPAQMGKMEDLVDKIARMSKEVKSVKTELESMDLPRNMAPISFEARHRLEQALGHIDRMKTKAAEAREN